MTGNETVFESLFEVGIEDAPESDTEACAGLREVFWLIVFPVGVNVALRYLGIN